jgi:hypothetical protein
MLFDEPTSALDPEMINEVLALPQMASNGKICSPLFCICDPRIFLFGHTWRELAIKLWRCPWSEISAVGGRHLGRVLIKAQQSRTPLYSESDRIAAEP